MPRGRPPKPTKVKILEGNPGKRPLGSEPEPAQDEALVKPPSHLSRLAKQEWKRVAPELYHLGILTTIDGAALETYCEAYAIWRIAKAALKGGLTYETETGYRRQKPEVGIAKDAAATMRAYMVEFGMTPSARGRMSLPDPDDDDIFFDRFLASKPPTGTPLASRPGVTR